MIQFILLAQVSTDVADEFKKRFPPTPGCGCAYCDALSKPNAPFIGTFPCETAEEANFRMEELKSQSDFVALVSLEDDMCFVYKAKESFETDTDLMTIAFGAYEMMAFLSAGKPTDKFTRVVDARVKN